MVGAWGVPAAFIIGAVEEVAASPDTVLVGGVLGVAAAIIGALGKAAFDHARHPRENGNGGAAAVKARAEVEFQTRMTVLMENLTNAIERGQSAYLDRVQTLCDSVQEAAGVIHEVHEEIKRGRHIAVTTDVAAVETHRLVKEIHRTMEKRGVLRE